MSSKLFINNIDPTGFDVSNHDALFPAVVNVKYSQAIYETCDFVERGERQIPETHTNFAHTNILPKICENTVFPLISAGPQTSASNKRRTSKYGAYKNCCYILLKAKSRCIWTYSMQILKQ